MEEDGKFIVLTKCGKPLIIDDECSLLFRQMCLTVRFTSQSNQNKYIVCRIDLASTNLIAREIVVNRKQAIKFFLTSQFLPRIKPHSRFVTD